MKYLTLGNQARITVGQAALFQTDEPNRHTDRVQGPYEILFTRSGCLGIQEDGVAFEVHQHQAILIFPGTEIRGTLQFQPEMVLNFVHFTLDGPPDAGEQRITIPQYTVIRRPERLANLFHLLIEEQSVRNNDGPTQQLLTRLILHELAHSPSPSDIAAARRSSPQQLADRAANWIAEHVAEDISTHDVAAALSHHPNYLSRVFREHHEHTIVEHIHARRIELARQLLIATADPIRHIALACGFNEEGYFRRVFRRHTRMTPRAFRATYSPIQSVRAN